MILKSFRYICRFMLLRLIRLSNSSENLLLTRARVKMIFMASIASKRKVEPSGEFAGVRMKTL